MNTSPTLKEIAKLLNINPSTVSRALKNHPDISKETREKVLHLAKELNYIPNVIASGLRNKKSYQLAVIVPQIKNDYYGNIVSHILDYILPLGYRLILFESKNNPEQEIKICRLLPKIGIDGVMISTATRNQDGHHLKELKENHLPVVLFDRIQGDLDTDRVINDDYQGAYSIVDYMIKGGCRSILHITGNLYLQSIQKRQMGYLQALTDHHLPIDRTMILSEPEKLLPEHFLRFIQTHPIDGIFAYEDKIAIQILQELKKTGYKIPEDIAIAGFSDSPESLVTTPSLTTIHLDSGEMGTKTAELLLNKIQNQSEETKTYLLKTFPVIRESTRSLF